jgi:hypothetical protein
VTPEVIGMIAVAAISLLGTIFTGYMQYKTSRDNSKRDADEAERRRADNAEKELEKKRKEEEQRNIDDKFKELSDKLERVSSDIQIINGRLDNQKIAFDKRIEQAEANIRMIIQVLSKNAREYSTMMKMHQQTEERLQVMMNIETQNLKFSKELSSTLGTIAEILSRSLEDDDAKEEVRTTMENNRIMDKEFMDVILEAQKEFFAQAAAKDKSIPAERPITDLHLFPHQ